MRGGGGGGNQGGKELRVGKKVGSELWVGGVTGWEGPGRGRAWCCRLVVAGWRGEIPSLPCHVLLGGHPSS